MSGPAVDDARIERAIEARLGRCAPGASACPSEVARALPPDGDWRALMPAVRARALAMAGDGRLRITQRGRALDPGEMPVGPIRLRPPR